VRIAWASPLERRSAIARVSADAVRALVAHGHQVEFIATEMDAGSEPLHEVPAKVVHWRARQSGDLAADNDILIANIGDNYLFHAGIFPLLGTIPTVGIFHDCYLYNLFNGWLWDGGRRGDAERAQAHDRAVVETYGVAMEAQAREARSGLTPLEEIAQSMPMTEWLGGRCHGALAHAGYYRARLLASCPGPVHQAMLPVTSRAVPPLGVRAPGPVTVLTVGVMNPNKCADRVIRAIAGAPQLRSRVIYKLVGPIEPAEAARLQAVADEHGYEQLVIQGPASDEELARELEAADIICGLRKPVLEGASGSAIEALQAGRPLIVADAGFYAERPDAFVSKVGPEVDEAELAEQLQRLVEDEPLRRRLGEAARDWAQARCNPDDYSRAVEVLAKETLQAYATIEVGVDVGRRLAALGLSRRDPAVGRISAILSPLFAAE
jgi:glycosyltransferase involved in cell wall biosynthesis